MLGQRLEGNGLKSQTIPRMDGQDEDSFINNLEEAYDMMSITNSCPDLSILVESNSNGIIVPTSLTTTTMTDNFITVRNSNSKRETEDDVDGLLHHLIPNKIPLSLRRSTSLNSLDADGYARENSNSVDGNVGGVLVGNGTNIKGKCLGTFEKSVKIDPNNYNGRGTNGTSNEFTLQRSSQRSSYTGPGFFHKSISSPSMQSVSSISNVGGKLMQLSQGSTSRTLSVNHSQGASSKRSFFRRKHKSKSRIPSDQRFQHSYSTNDMGKFTGGLPLGGGDDVTTNNNNFESIGYIALTDPFMSLKEPDIECWTLFMSPETVNKLNDKEIKRQEHMYEFILTEKHHCLTLALMHHLFVGGMRNAGYNRESRILFPGLSDLLQVHFDFFRRLREKQMKYKSMEEPLDTLADILTEQFTGDLWISMVRLYGLLCSSLEKSFELFKTMKQKDQRFGQLVETWGREPLLSRKNVSECLLLVGQRITKYPLLIEPLLKTSPSLEEKSELIRALKASRDLNSGVNERVAERERLYDVFAKIDSKSIVTDGQKRYRRDDLLSLPSRRLLFYGQATVIRQGSSIGVCNMLMMSDSMVLTQELSGKISFVSPPGMTMLDQVIYRENASHPSSIFLFLGTASSNKPEMIEIHVRNPGDRTIWTESLKLAKSIYEEEADLCSDIDDDLSDTSDLTDLKSSKSLDELHEVDRKIVGLLKSRSKIIENLKSEKPYYWAKSTFEGKDSVLKAISEASKEIGKTLHDIENNSNGVNRSTSCVSEHMLSSAAAAALLPRRADTFGGFDSQQRSSIDASITANNKELYQIVVQLADLCGEMFKQMVPNLSANLSHNHNQLQKRMEELREAQQRFETEKANWQHEFNVQREEAERERMELKNYKDALKKQEADISQQREQLYRKLEKLETQGIKPYLDSVSISPAVPVTIPQQEKPPTQPRRPPPVPSHPTSSISHSNIVGANKHISKQQLPLHLASLSKASNSPNEPPKPLPRTVSAAAMSPTGKASDSSINNDSPSELVRHSSTNSMLRGSNRHPQASSVQQMLPLKLSETLGSLSSTGGKGGSSGPRGLPASKSTNNIIPVSLASSSNNGNSPRNSSSSKSGLLHHSKSSGNILTNNANGGNEHFQNGPTYYYQSNTPSTNDRMSNYHRNTPEATLHGIQYSGSDIPVVHKRSGSSPVPMSGTHMMQGNVQSNGVVRIPYTQTNIFPDDDSSKILFL